MASPLLDNSTTPPGVKWHPRNISMAQLRGKLGIKSRSKSEVDLWAKQDSGWRLSKDQLEHAKIGSCPEVDSRIQTGQTNRVCDFTELKANATFSLVQPFLFSVTCIWFQQCLVSMISICYRFHVHCPCETDVNNTTSCYKLSFILT